MNAGDWESLLRERVTEAGDYAVVPFAWCREAAKRAGVSPLDMEIFALGRGICPSRYERNVGTLGLDGQRKLLESCVAVMGCGGLGGLIVELLARAGIGHLLLADGDTFSESNLNRQLLCAESDIGRGKAEAAGARARAVNGALDVRVFCRYIDEENVSECMEGASLAVDALDNNRSRTVVLGECRRRGIPFVHGAVGGFWAQAGVFQPGDRTPWDFREEVPDRGVELTAGTPPFAPAFTASLEASLALRLLSGAENVESGVLYWCDLSEMSMRGLRL